jgi:hypothetical protein
MIPYVGVVVGVVFSAACAVGACQWRLGHPDSHPETVGDEFFEDGFGVGS